MWLLTTVPPQLSKAAAKAKKAPGAQIAIPASSLFMETLEGSSSSLSPSDSESFNACSFKHKVPHSSDEMGRTDRNEEGSGYEAPRIQKRSFSTTMSCKEPAQHILYSQIDCLQASDNNVGQLYTEPLSPEPHPLYTLPAGHIPESSILLHTSFDTGKRISSSVSEGKFENVKVLTNLLTKCLNNSSAYETDISTKNQTGRHNVDAEVVTNISVALCPVNTPEPSNKSMIPMVGRLMSKTEVKATSLSNKRQKEILSKSNILIKQEPAEDVNNVDQPYSQAIIPLREASDRSANDRIRRAKITEGIKLLQNCVPCSDKGSRESLLDDAIDYIKFLKLQLKVLSLSRLCGEATPHPIVHLEGYGHYLCDHLMGSDPLEEVMGQLMETNMQAANELLEKKGLTILPMDLAYTLLRMS